MTSSYDELLGTAHAAMTDGHYCCSECDVARVLAVVADALRGLPYWPHPDPEAHDGAVARSDVLALLTPPEVTR